MSAESYIMREMTWPEVEEALKKVEAALIPVGSHEQHGPHLAESADSIRAEKFARLLAERMHPALIITPTVNFGVSRHHMAFPGTISLEPSTLQFLLHDIISSLYEHGLEKIIIFNAHGGNDAPIEVAIEEIRAEIDVRLTSFKHSDLIEEKIDELVASQTYGHACQYEVSEVMYLAPEKVDEENLSPGDIKDLCRDYMESKAEIGVDFHEITGNGALGDARKADPEMGEKIIEAALDEVEDFVNAFIDKF